MQQMVSSLLGLAERPEPADAADALAVALCHAHLMQARDRIIAATGLRPAAEQPRIRKRTARVP
jgi:crossover junction endodeoxyribonuclease RuvC